MFARPGNVLLCSCSAFFYFCCNHVGCWWILVFLAGIGLSNLQRNMPRHVLHFLLLVTIRCDTGGNFLIVCMRSQYQTRSCSIKKTSTISYSSIAKHKTTNIQCVVYQLSHRRAAIHATG